jgi:hypothetical protein
LQRPSRPRPSTVRPRWTTTPSSRPPSPWPPRVRWQEVSNSLDTLGTIKGCLHETRLLRRAAKFEVPQFLCRPKELVSSDQISMFCVNMYKALKLGSMSWTQLFAIFLQFSAKKLAFFSKTNGMIKILHILDFLSQKRHFFRWIFGRKFLINHTSVPGKGHGFNDGDPHCARQ